MAFRLGACLGTSSVAMFLLLTSECGLPSVRRDRPLECSVAPHHYQQKGPAYSSRRIIIGQVLAHALRSDTDWCHAKKCDFAHFSASRKSTARRHRPTLRMRPRWSPWRPCSRQPTSLELRKSRRKNSYRSFWKSKPATRANRRAAAREREGCPARRSTVSGRPRTDPRLRPRGRPVGCRKFPRRCPDSRPSPTTRTCPPTGRPD